MAFKRVRILVRVDCTPIADTKQMSDKFRSIPEFQELFTNYDYFKIGDTTNYRNGTIKDLDPTELVYRYSRVEDDGQECIFDITSRFYYIRVIANDIPDILSKLCDIVESATKIVLETDHYVTIRSYGAGVEFEEKRDGPLIQDVDKIVRDAYTSHPENVRIIYQKKEQSDAVRFIIVAAVNVVPKNPNYKSGGSLFDRSFKNAMEKAERRYAING